MESNKIDLSGLSSADKGDIVEDRIKELILLHGKGELNVYRPVTDTEGIDLIVKRKEQFQPIFLQVKGRFTMHGKSTLIVDIRSKNFKKHHSFYIVAAHFDGEKLELHDNLFLIPSNDLIKVGTIVKARGQERYRIVASIKDEYKGKWKEFVVKKSDLANKLLDKFDEMKRYIR